MIRIEINNSTAKLSGNTPVLNSLYHYLKFKHPNAYHIQKYIKYRWDGFVYPLSDAGNIKTGLLEKVLEFTSEHEEDYELIDHRKIPELFDIPTKIADIDLHPHSIEALKAIAYNEIFTGCPHPRGIVLASMNAGKTLMMCGVHAMYKNAKTIILLNNATLFDQFKKDLAQTYPDSYGFLRGKKVKWGDIMVVMVQSLKNRLEDYREKLLEYQILLTDEADLAANKTFEDVYKKLQHMSVRVGFTGTAFMRNLAKDTLRNTKMLEIFGNVLFNISMKDLEDLNISTPAIIKSIYGNTRKISVKDFKDEFDQCITYNQDRNEIIYKRVMYNLRTRRRNIMIFCKYLNQTTELHEYLAKRIPNKYSIAYIHHKIKDPKIIEDFKEGRINILVSSLFLKRGMNFPWIKTIINAAGGALYSNPLQIIGRAVRKHFSKDKVFIEDIYDIGKYLEKHSKQRLKYYRDQKLSIRDLRKLKK